MWQRGVWANRKRTIQYNAYTREENETIAENAGKMDIYELAEYVSRLYGVYRTPKALETQLGMLGFPIEKQGMSPYAASRFFGVHYKTVNKWIDDGLLLCATKKSNRGRTNPWILPSDLEVFIRQYPWKYDFRKLRSRHPLTRVAEIVNKTRPYFWSSDVAKVLNVSQHEIYRMARDGIIESKIQCGYGYRTIYRIPATEVARLRANVCISSDTG